MKPPARVPFGPSNSTDNSQESLLGAGANEFRKLEVVTVRLHVQMLLLN